MDDIANLHAYDLQQKEEFDVKKVACTACPRYALTVVLIYMWLKNFGTCGPRFTGARTSL